MTLKTTTIKQTVFMPAKPMEAYETLIDPKKHAEFTESGASGEPKEGGEFTAWDGYIFGKHLKLAPGKKLTQEWQTTEWPDGYPPSRLEFTFTPKDGGTEITMIHSDVPAEQADQYKQGWIDYYWEPMKKYFAK